MEFITNFHMVIRLMMFTLGFLGPKKIFKTSKHHFESSVKRVDIFVIFLTKHNHHNWIQVSSSSSLLLLLSSLSPPSSSKQIPMKF
jgi:nitrate/nitrite-specific signal transduction histidine kinase